MTIPTFTHSEILGDSKIILQKNTAEECYHLIIRDKEASDIFIKTEEIVEDIPINKNAVSALIQNVSKAELINFCEKLLEIVNTEIV